MITDTYVIHCLNNTQNSFVPQMKTVELRLGKKKHLIFLFQCPGNALLIDTNFTYEKKHVSILVKKYVSMNIYQ